MSLNYPIMTWKNHVTEFLNKYTMTQNPDGTITLTPNEGSIIQQGTPQNALNFNNMEQGIFNATELAQMVLQRQLQNERQLKNQIGETGTGTTSNTRAYPFNDSGTSIALSTKRTNTNYSVEIEVLSETGGFAEKVIVYDKQINGFKVRHTGSASSVNFKYIVRGGL